MWSEVAFEGRALVLNSCYSTELGSLERQVLELYIPKIPNSVPNLGSASNGFCTGAATVSVFCSRASYFVLVLENEARQDALH
jgi:hypothetical protein